MGSNDNDIGELKDKEFAPHDVNENTFKKNKSKVIIVSVIVLFIATNILSCLLSFKFITGSYLSDVGEYRKIGVVRSIIDKFYNGDYEYDNLIDNAIKGMVNSLGDPYTVYMDEEEYAEFNLSIKGGYVGVGVEVAPDSGKVVILSVLDNSPAKRSGLKEGDYIIEVSGHKISDGNVDEVRSLLIGDRGTSVSLIVERNGDKIPYTLERDSIYTPSVESIQVQDDVLYIKLSVFDEDSYDGIKEALNSSSSRGIILDLRGNPGGMVNSCIDIASEFIKEGNVIYSSEDKAGHREVVKSHGGSAQDREIVVLGDYYSASASEILIGALRDNDRAFFVGTRTFGKGVAQRVFDLGGVSGFKVTSSKNYTPNGDYINKVGIEPDLYVDYPQSEVIKNKKLAQGDKELLLRNDPQYNKALEVLLERLNN